jgi:hypothetical protein
VLGFLFTQPQQTAIAIAQEAVVFG